MKSFAAIFPLLCLCAGCLTSSVPQPKTWMVSPSPAATRAATPASGAFAVTRQGAVSVCAPFDRTTFVVRRADGSVALDAYNVFAAAPSVLLRAPVKARLEADGRFGRVVPQTSGASAEVQVEVLVRDLSLDCSSESHRKARSAVSIDVIRLGRGARDVILSGDGEGTADAEKGDYSESFSAAFDAALSAALRNLREQPPSVPIEQKTKGDSK